MTDLYDMRSKFETGFNPPSFVLTGLAYLTHSGSRSYGVATENSDHDMMGFVVPPMEDLFPHYMGVLPGFDKYSPFEQWHQPKLVDRNGMNWDFTVYNIVKFFRLTLDANPNMLDTLYTADKFVVESNRVGEWVRRHRELFLSQRVYDRYVGYAKSQLPKVTNPNKLGNETRMASFVEHGYDTKAVYHLFRLLYQARDLLTYGTMDLEANAATLKKIRAGEYSVDWVNNQLQYELTELQNAKDFTKLPVEPRHNDVKKLLLECLEMTYGTVPGGNWHYEHDDLSHTK